MGLFVLLVFRFCQILIFQQLLRESERKVLLLSCLCQPYHGKVDTGNSVVEPFSQIPVIIVEKSVFGKNEIPTTRIIPYKALGNHGILNGFKPDKVFISKKEIKKNIYIGIYNGNIDTNVKAIINSEIVR